jgi:hypothetical protein
MLDNERLGALMLPQQFPQILVFWRYGGGI